MDTEKLVEAVTKIIMERLGESPGCPAESVVTFGDVPDCVVGAGMHVRQGTSPADTDGAAYIVLTQAAFRAFHGGATPAGLSLPAPAAAAGCCGGGAAVAVAAPAAAVFDLTGKRVVGERDLRTLNMPSGSVVKVSEHAIVTALARDFISSHGASLAH